MKEFNDPNGTAKYINKLNKVKVLNLIRNSDRISRADIAKMTKLSAPTVSRIVESLMDVGLVDETGPGDSTGGRRPTLLKFSADNNFIIGIDLGTTNIYGVLSNLEAKIIAEKSRPTWVQDGFQSIMVRTAEVIEELKGQLGDKADRIFGVGMAVAGLINRDRNIVEFSPDFHWHNVDVVGELSRRHNMPIVFDNVTRVMALGEYCYGIGKQFKNFVCVNVGYGIGAGIIMNGEPLYGPKGMAGEFGHLTLEKDSGVQCECGNFGCLEALASGNALAKAARSKLQAGAKSSLEDMCGNDLGNITAKMVADAAKQGDAVAWDVFNRSAEFLGIGIAGLINLLSPEAIVIGGGVAQSGDILFDIVRKTVNSRALNKISREVAILPATFGMRAAVMGAVSLILDKVLNLEQANRQEST
jgi:glucokinase-like ROK family protein